MMIVGVPREIKDNEYRVSMTTGGVAQLIEAGHEVRIETGAGEGSGFLDAQYSSSGARIVPTSADAWSAEMVIKVKEPQPGEYRFLRPDLTLFTYLHLAASERVTR
jgi:alanine dehydrogenase